MLTTSLHKRAEEQRRIRRRKRAAGWRDLNFIRIRSRRRSIFLTLGYVNNFSCARARPAAYPAGAPRSR